MSIAKKIIMGTATTSVIGGSATATYLFFKTTNNNNHTKQALSKIGFEPLDLTQQGGGDWAPILAAYQTAKKDIFDDILPSKVNEKILQERCQKASQKINDYKEKLLASKWCSKRQTITETFSKVGLTILNENSSDEDWGKLIGEDSNKQDIIKELKKICKNIGSTYTTDDKFADNLGIAKNSCAIEKQNH